MPSTGILQGVAGVVTSKAAANSGKPAYIRRTCHPLGKVSASRVDHSGHNIAGQFLRSRAIPVGRVERNDESTGLERHVPPP